MVPMDQWVNKVFLVNKELQVVRVTMVQWENKVSPIQTSVDFTIFLR